MKPKLNAGMPQSIAWKLALPIPVFAVLAVVSVWLFVPPMVEQNVRADAVRSAVQTAGQFKTMRGYYTKNVIKKVLEEGTVNPSFNHKNEADGIPLPATFIHDMSELLAEADTTVNLYSDFPFPVRGERTLDEYQKQAWAFLGSAPKENYVREESRNGRQIVRVGVADTMSAQGCVSCHNSHPESPKTDWKLGDVRGVLEVATVIDSQLAAGAALSNRIIMGTVFGALLMVLVSVIGARRLTEPLRRMTTAMRDLAEGNNDVDVPATDRKDEIGEMASAVLVFKENAERNRTLEQEKERERLLKRKEREVAERLTKEFASEIGEIVGAVSTASAELSATAQSMAGISEQASNRVSTVSNASDRVSTNVQAIASATDEMSATIGEITSQVSHVTTDTRDAVERVEATGEQITALAETADTISEATKMISEIADQTNLLALNATIESARAGEAGKGFAVVAGEVKELAGQTGKAAEQIIAQIDQVQAATKQAVASMNDVGTIIGKVDGASATVAAAIEQQGAAVQEISQRIQEAASEVGNVSSEITMVAENSRDVDGAARQVTEASDDLSKQATVLNTEVDSFLVGLRDGEKGGGLSAPEPGPGEGAGKPVESDAA